MSGITQNELWSLHCHTLFHKVLRISLRCLINLAVKCISSSYYFWNNKRITQSCEISVKISLQLFSFLFVFVLNTQLFLVYFLIINSTILSTAIQYSGTSRKQPQPSLGGLLWEVVTYKSLDYRFQIVWTELAPIYSKGICSMRACLSFH